MLFWAFKVIALTAGIFQVCEAANQLSVKDRSTAMTPETVIKDLHPLADDVSAGVRPTPSGGMLTWLIAADTKTVAFNPR